MKQKVGMESDAILNVKPDAREQILCIDLFHIDAIADCRDRLKTEIKT